MTDHVMIELLGQDGSYWCLSGPGAGRQGITLSPSVQQFYDAPVKTLWVPGPFGQEYVGMRVQRRELVLNVQSYGGDPETWAAVDSGWRWAWDYATESTLRVTTSQGGARWLKVRLLEEPKPYYEKDPFITADNPCVMTLAAEFPYWQTDPYTDSYVITESSGSNKFWVRNDGDVPVWPSWILTAPGTWVLPDYSWGNNMYSRATADAARTVTLPALSAGENLSADSDPRVQTLIAANGAPVQNRWRGRDLLYPIMPGKEGAFKVSVSGATGGAGVQLTVPRWFSRPWSRPGRLSS